jgi:xanthine phosphoribosyltransferase
MDKNKDKKFLEQEFLNDVRVWDKEKGYLSVPSFNMRMKPEVLAAAGRLIASEFMSEKVSVVHGIPHSGNYLATAVALNLGGEVRLHASRKDQNIPAQWKDVYREEVRSFATTGEGVDVFSGINLSFVKKGDRVLVCDDLCARGEVGERIVKGLIDRGVTVVGFAVLMDKMFQGGLESIAGLGVKVYSCVRVLELGANDRVVLG